MEINEQWLPIIVEAVKWAKDKMKLTKSDLQLKVSDLEEQVKILSYGNKSLSNDIDHIMSIIKDQLSSGGQYKIYADTIIQIVGNNGQMHIEKDDKISNILCNNDEKHIEAIFDNIDEEIKECKLMRPSERE